MLWLFKAVKVVYGSVAFGQFWRDSVGQYRFGNIGSGKLRLVLL